MFCKDLSQNITESLHQWLQNWCCLYCVSAPRFIVGRYCFLGCHYTAFPPKSKNRIAQYVYRKGNCYDNSVMENFFGHLKSELIYLQEFDSIEHFKADLIDCIDYYNNRRIKARLKGLPPALHRQQALLAAWTIWVRNICLTFGDHFTVLWS